MENFFNNLLFWIVKFLLCGLVFLEIIILYIIINHIERINFENPDFVTLVIIGTVDSVLFISLSKYYSEIKEKIKQGNPKQIKS